MTAGRRSTSREEGLNELRIQLACSHDGEEQATALAIAQQTRAEAAEAQRDRLMDEVERLRAGEPL